MTYVWNERKLVVLSKALEEFIEKENSETEFISLKNIAEEIQIDVKSLLACMNVTGLAKVFPNIKGSLVYIKGRNPDH